MVVEYQVPQYNELIGFYYLDTSALSEIIESSLGFTFMQLNLP